MSEYPEYYEYKYRYKYKCKICGELIYEIDRVDHARIHHPGTTPAKIKQFFLVGDFTKVQIEASLLDKNSTNSLSDVSNESASKENNPKSTDNHTVAVKYNDYHKEEKSKKIPREFSIRTNTPQSSQDEDVDLLNYRPANILYTPRSGSDHDLFEFAVKRIAHRYQSDPNILESKAHNQWMNICFDRLGYNALTKSNYMSSLKCTYKEYFKKGAGPKYTFDFQKIARDYPQFFAFGIKSYQKKIGLEAMIEVMSTELKLSRQWDKKEKYNVLNIARVTKHKDRTIYALELKLDDSKVASFAEALNMVLKTNHGTYNCDCVDFDEDEEILYISSPATIFDKIGILYLDTTFILEKILYRLEQVKEFGLEEGQPAQKFIDDKTTKLKVRPQEKTITFEHILQGTDSFQRKAINAVLEHDITFIWGPPGTGKSFTMASMINIFGLKKETTLVCCISNVAVDQLLNKVIDRIDKSGYKPYNCEFIRAGFTTDTRILETDYLFPNNFTINTLRKRIRDINKSLSKISRLKPTPSEQVHYLTLIEERIKLREELKEHIDRIYEKSRIVFSTIANYVLANELENKAFDNLIIDEASMLSMPYLVALGRKVFKRIILVGDPNQLGPISITPADLLSKSVYHHCNVLSEVNPHPGLKQLLIQRRSHRSIVNLINEVFYKGKLEAVVEESPRWVKHIPFRDKVIKVVNPESENNHVSFVGTSRYNIGTREEVMDILAEYYEYYRKTRTSFSIGVITPFRAQASKYRKEIRNLYDNNGFWEDIKVGTVHTFQGSECDIIIFDLVEKDDKVSRIFHSKDGERLINVALSRARHQLIIVGDTQRFRGGAGLANVSPKTCRVIERLRDVNASSYS